jgi:hypothetical protein
MSKAEFFLNFLTQEGFRGEIDEDGDVSFKFEGRRYYILVHEDDTEYCCILYNQFWRIESAEELQRALLHANDSTSSTKVAKVYVIGEQTNVSATVEMFLGDLENIRGIFMRQMTALQTATRKFREKMQQTAPPETSTDS